MSQPMLDPKLIVINRETRQRREFTVDDLIESIKRRGIINPLTVHKDTLELVAGERRLTAALQLGLKEVPVRYYENLNKLELRELELAENVHRMDLSWQDQALAAFELHQMYVAESDALHFPNGRDEDVDPKWSLDASAERMGLSRRQGTKYIKLGEVLAGGDESIAKIDTLSAAYNTLERRRERSKAEAVQRIMEMATSAFKPKPKVELKPVIDSETGEPTGRFEPVAEPAKPEESPYQIIHADMLTFLPEYSGPKFNFLHMDLPYGVPLHGQANQQVYEGGGYESSADIYWELLECVCKHWSKFMYPSAHIMTWFAFLGNDGEGFYQETIQLLEKSIPNLVIDRQPLIWHKSDNKGILSDASRRARNIGEYALMGATNDRKIVRSVSNIYSCPTAKGADSIHTNEKPQPMLHSFFSMFVDSHTRMLDPTAGSGSAIRAAEVLGAEAAIGLELNPEFARRAQKKLEQDRTLRLLSKKVKGDA